MLGKAVIFSRGKLTFAHRKWGASFEVQLYCSWPVLIFQHREKKKASEASAKHVRVGAGEVSEAIQRRPAFSNVLFCAGIHFCRDSIRAFNESNQNTSTAWYHWRKLGSLWNFDWRRTKGKPWERGCSNRGIVWSLSRLFIQLFYFYSQNPCNIIFAYFEDVVVFRK